MSLNIIDVKPFQNDEAEQLFAKLAEWDNSVYPKLDEITWSTDRDIASILLAVSYNKKMHDEMFRKAILDILLAKDYITAEEIDWTNIDERLDYPDIERRALILEDGTRELLNSKEFADFTEHYWVAQLTARSTLAWEKLFRQLHLADMQSVEKETLLNYWLENGSNLLPNFDTEQPFNWYKEQVWAPSVRSVIRDHGGFDSADGTTTIYNMSAEDWSRFIRSYHTGWAFPARSQDMQAIIDFIIYAYRIKLKMATKKTADEIISA